MEIPAEQLTLDRVIQTCRHIELTNAPIRTLDSLAVNVAHMGRRGRRSRTQPFPNNNSSFCHKCCLIHAFRN